MNNNFNGVFLCDKPADWTSHDVVGWLRPRIGITKIGHGGTLDPFATGLLLIMIGSATKQSENFKKTKKRYVGTVFFGVHSSTNDCTGIFTPTEKSLPTLQEIEQVLQQFQGDILQIPPIFSAKKINGTRAYLAARSGTPLQLAPQKVTIFSFSTLSYEPPLWRFSLICSGGFYVRSLARDMGNILGCGAYLHSLRRESVGDFSLPGFCPSEHNTQYHSKEVWREILEKYRAPHLRKQ